MGQSEGQKEPSNYKLAVSRHKEHVSVVRKWLLRETDSRSKEIRSCRVLKTIVSQ